MIERFLTQTHFSSEEDYRKNLHFNIPENFNFAYDVMDVWAEEQPDKVALIWTNDEGEERFLRLPTSNAKATRRQPILPRSALDMATWS